MTTRIVGRVLGAQALSSIGTSMSTVALAVMVNKLTGSVLQMGAVLAASTIPLVFTALVGGAFLDRYSSRALMVAADFVRAGLIFAMPFLALRFIWLVYVVAALMGVFTGVFNPGQIKLVGEVVPQERLVKVNSYLSVSRDGAELIGYLAGAFVASLAGVTLLGYALTGWTMAFFVDAASYVASAILLLGLPRVAAAAGANVGLGVSGAAGAPGRAAPSLGRLIAGSPGVVASLWRRPVLRTNLLMALFAMGAVMMNVPNSFILAQDVFRRGSLGLGALEVFVAVGLILGGLVVSRSRMAGDKNGIMLLCVVAMAGCYVAVGFSPWFWPSLVLMGLAGAADVGAVVASITMFQEIPASPAKGRLIAVRSSAGQLGVAAGFLVGGLVGDYIGVKHAFLVTGGASIVLGVLIYLPYRVAAGRRRREAWTAATEAGARRTHAREFAHQAAFSGLVVAGGSLSGPGIRSAGWAAAEAAEANVGSEL